MYLPLIFIIPLGLVIGSFLNVCIYRIPRGESIVFPGSHCASCNESILKRDLIPVISYIRLKGKCRSCGEHISLRYPLVEILTALVFTQIYVMFVPKGEVWYTVFLAVFFCVLIVVSFIDFENGIIPDKIVLPGVVVGFLFNALGSNFSGSVKFVSWSESLIGIVVGAVPLYLIGLVGSLIAKRDAMGGGDVKFMAMVGAFLGWRMAIITGFLGVVIGAIVGIIIKVAIRNKDIEEDNDGRDLTEMPFGLMLAIGAAIAALYGWDILFWYLRLFI